MGRKIDRAKAMKKMRRVKKMRTVCEVLRDINDLVQDKKEPDNTIRELLLEAEVMAKKMTWKLLEYNKKALKGFWEKNPDYKEKLERRIKKSYLTGKDVNI